MHFATHSQIRERYPKIYGEGSGGKAKAGNTGFESWLYAVAGEGYYMGLVAAGEATIWEIVEAVNFISYKYDSND